MTKTKILSVLLASLACVALLGSCDYWKEDYYKSGGDTASVASCGSGSGSTASVPTYSGNLTVNGASYTTLAMDGTSTSGTATLSGSAGSLSGTYARAVATAAAASEFTGSYTITFSSGTITVTFNGNSITLTNGSITASGTGTLVVQASGGSSGGYKADGERMTAEEQAVYNSLLGTHWKWEEVPLAQRGTDSDPKKNKTNPEYRCAELIVNTDASGRYMEWYEDRSGTKTKESNWRIDDDEPEGNNRVNKFDYVELASHDHMVLYEISTKHKYTGLGWGPDGGIRDTNGDGTYDTPCIWNNEDYRPFTKVN